jgi:hypothetical protein
MAKKKTKKIKNTQLDWMMWRIDEKQLDDPPLVNLVRAIEYYNDKYGRIPNRCEVAKGWAEELVVPEGMLLTQSKSVQKGHLMLATDPAVGVGLPGK